jgi:hypothetical protein
MDEDRSAEVNTIVPEEGTTSSQGGVVVANAEEGETSPQGEVVVASAGEGATEEEAVLLEEKEEAKGRDGEVAASSQGEVIVASAGRRRLRGRKSVAEVERERREIEINWKCWRAQRRRKRRIRTMLGHLSELRERRLAEVRGSAGENGEDVLKEMRGISWIEEGLVLELDNI